MAEFKGGTLIGGNIVWHYGNFDPDSKSDVGHGHTIADITNLQASLDSKSNNGHGHTIANVSGLQAALDAKSNNHSHPYRPDNWVPSWDQVTGKPSLAASNHNHDSVYFKLSGGKIGNQGSWEQWSYTDVKVQNTDAGLAIVSTHDGNEGSRLIFGESNAGKRTNAWSFSRKTTGGGLTFSLKYGTTGTDVNANGSVVDFYTNKKAAFRGDVHVDKNMVVQGNLTVEGTVTTVNSETVTIADNIILLNSNEAGAPTQDGGLEIERGTSANAGLLWKEGIDEWIVHKGSTHFKLFHEGHKPKWSEVEDKPSLAASVHNHTSLNNVTGIHFAAQDTDNASITTVIDGTHTYFDFNLTDDNNNDYWRWRFTPSGQPTYNAMVLKPVTNGNADLTVSGKVIADSFQGSSFTGNAATASKLATTRNIALTGDVTGNVNFDGSGNVSISTQVGNDSHWHSQVYIQDTRGAKRAPSYYPDRYVSYDFQNTADTEAGGDTWHVLQTIAKWSSFNASHSQEQLAYTGGNIKHRHATSDSAWSAWKTLAYTSDNVASASKLATARTIALSGDVTGQVNFDGSGNVTISTAVVNGSHSHDTQYLGKTAKAVDSNLLDGLDSSAFGKLTSAQTWSGINTFNKQMKFKTPSQTQTMTFEADANGQIGYFDVTHLDDQSAGGNFAFHFGSTENITNVILDGNGSFIGALKGNADTATKLKTARTISLGGDASGSITFDGAANKTLTVTVKDNSHSHSNYVPTSDVSQTATYAGMLNKIPKIQGNGVMEIARYIDFHAANSTADYDVRLNANSANELRLDGGALNITGGNLTVSGDQIFNGSRIVGDGKEIIRYSDAWLRINEDNNFSSGTYFGNTVVRSDGQLQVGGNGDKFKATNSGEVTASGSISAGKDLQAKSGKVKLGASAEASMQYNAATESIDFTFA